MDFGVTLHVGVHEGMLIFLAIKASFSVACQDL